MDGWSGDHIGTFHGLSTIDRREGPTNGTRSYAVTGYLLPNVLRPNLHVLTDAPVSRLVISSDNKTVTGIEFFHGDKAYTVNAKKEVILSAGALKSPQILELSGIGNPEILTKAGIKITIENLRVGENFQDHPATGCGYELVEGEKSLDMLQDEAVAGAFFGEYMANQTGPISSGGSAHCFASFVDLSTPEEVAALQKTILEFEEEGGHSEEAKKILASDLGKTTDSSIHIVPVMASMISRKLLVKLNS